MYLNLQGWAHFKWIFIEFALQLLLRFYGTWIDTYFLYNITKSQYQRYNALYKVLEKGGWSTASVRNIHQT